MSLAIELLQMFGGRYAEIDDFLMNTPGALTGYFFHVCLRDFRKNRKRTLCSLIALAAALAVCFTGIYFISDRSEEMPDGFSAVESNISEIRIYCRGESQAVQADSEAYHKFSGQMSNCGGHLLEVQDSADGEAINHTDCFIEIQFAEPQNISFENAENFSISNADRILYNCSKNILFWGYSDYQYYTDYTKLDAQLKEHKAEILAQYQELPGMIAQYFE